MGLELLFTGSFHPHRDTKRNLYICSYLSVRNGLQQDAGTVLENTTFCEVSVFELKVLEIWRLGQISTKSLELPFIRYFTMIHL